ncbi:hypothetical protein SAMN04488688_104412 [Paenibacillus sp. cl141a]|nr:hypothetical protein SAMN04488688_104412 [Paenibacillus sp. cl141a]
MWPAKVTRVDDQSKHARTTHRAHGEQCARCTRVRSVHGSDTASLTPTTGGVQDNRRHGSGPECANLAERAELYWRNEVVAFEFGFLLWINSFPEIQTQQRSEVQSARGAPILRRSNTYTIYDQLASSQPSKHQGHHCIPPYSNSERGNQS